jgi:hypothetical protein
MLVDAVILVPEHILNEIVYSKLRTCDYSSQQRYKKN